MRAAAVARRAAAIESNHAGVIIVQMLVRGDWLASNTQGRTRPDRWQSRSAALQHEDAKTRRREDTKTRRPKTRRHEDRRHEDDRGHVINCKRRLASTPGAKRRPH